MEPVPLLDLSGAFVLFSLWLGSLPALSLGPVVFRFFRARAPKFQQMALALALIVLGGMNLVQKVSQSRDLVTSHPETLLCGKTDHH